MGIPTQWVTEITHVKEGEYFVDEQRFGPYALWHHKHFIRPIEMEMKMEDIIDYKIPFGILGQIVHPIIVHPKLKEIFNYRQKNWWNCSENTKAKDEKIFDCRRKFGHRLIIGKTITVRTHNLIVANRSNEALNGLSVEFILRCGKW